jgi:hypothetical protein
MKSLITILLTGLFGLQGFSQKASDKSVLLISTKYYDGKCEYVAFQVTDEKIEIDNCYNLKTSKFNSKKTIEIDKEPTIKTIFEKSTEELKNYEKEINATNCDYIAPIYIIVTEEGKETKIEWKGIQNCYPESMKVTIEELEKVFEKYK